MKTHLFKQALESHQQGINRKRIAVLAIIDFIGWVFLVFCILGLMTGCADRNDPQVMAINNQTLQGPGEFVGTMGDGVRVYRWEIEMGTDYHNHFIYRFFPKKKGVKTPEPVLPEIPDPEPEWPEGFLNTTTINYSEQQGKTTVDRTLVLVE